MRLALLALVLTACVPTALEAKVPTDAKAFARYSFPASAARVAVGLEEEFGRAGFYLKAVKEDPATYSTIWSKVGGQVNDVYFEVEPLGDESSVLVFTRPYPPQSSNFLVESLKEMGEAIKTRLELQNFKLEPVK